MHHGDHGHDKKAHATVSLYWIFAAILCCITFAEWAVFKMEHLRSIAWFMVPVLLVLSIVKFTMVTGWYMHLRYDHAWLWKIFAAALAVVLIVFFIVTHIL